MEENDKEMINRLLDIIHKNFNIYYYTDYEKFLEYEINYIHFLNNILKKYEGRMSLSIKTEIDNNSSSYYIIMMTFDDIYEWKELLRTNVNDNFYYEGLSNTIFKCIENK